MMWSFMTQNRAGLACKIDGKIDEELYCKILDNALQGILKYYNKFPSDIIFQQDNNSSNVYIILINKNYRILDFLKNLYLENFEDGEKKFKIEFQEASRNIGDTTKALTRYVSWSELLLKKQY